MSVSHDHSPQLLHEEVLSHSALLDTISMKSAKMAEHYVTQLELQDLQERYNTVRENAMVTSPSKSIKVSPSQIHARVF